MYEFIFKVHGEIHFRCKLASIRCTGHTKNAQQCKRKCVIGSPFCYSHLLYRHHLRIKVSNLPDAGKGLFAMNPMSTNLNEIIFRKGQTICKYFGEIITLAQLNERYGDNTAPYTVKISQNRFVDAARVRGVGSLANTKPNYNNATITVHHNTVTLKATKNIRNGEEIYLAYGRAYRIHEEGVAFTTK